MRSITLHAQALLLALAITLFASSCSDDAHVEGCGLAVALDCADFPEAAGSPVTVTMTADDGQYGTSRTFACARALAACLFTVPPGCYTVTAETQDGLGGAARACADRGGVRRVTIRLAEGGAETPAVRLTVTLPDDYLPPFDGGTRSGGAPYVRRIIAEASPSGGGGRTVRREFTVDAAPGGTVEIELPVGEGVFDVLLWSDCVPADGGTSPFYDASDLRRVRLRTAAYEACTDYKDAACASLAGVGVTSEGGSAEAVMERPLAKYRIVARDIDRYRRLEGVPAVKDLTVSVSCEGFFPSSFNAAAGKPNNAVEGVGYASRPSWTTDADGLTELASDYVMVNGAESSVRLTVSVTAPDGSVVARTRGVKVPYKRGRLTTVAGDFLTAGRGGGGADIDTSWDDTTHEVEF